MPKAVVVLFLILTLVFTFDARSQEVKKTKVLIFAGQSNMDGKGDGLMLNKNEIRDLRIAGKKSKIRFRQQYGKN
jgi:hypothetical protein